MCSVFCLHLRARVCGIMVVCACVQALIRGFSDKGAVDAILKKQSPSNDEKIKVALGTLRTTKVVVEESKCHTLPDLATRRQVGTRNEGFEFLLGYSLVLFCQHT